MPTQSQSADKHATASSGIRYGHVRSITFDYFGGREYSGKTSLCNRIIIKNLESGIAPAISPEDSH
jgi:hypothetical protein